LEKPVKGPGFSLKSKEAVPKLKFWNCLTCKASSAKAAIVPGNPSRRKLAPELPPDFGPADRRGSWSRGPVIEQVY
jgi:hypothetical protein